MLYKSAARCSSALVTVCRRRGQCGVKPSKQAKPAAALARPKLLRFKHEKGQVGQESHLHPAVVEHAARCPDASKGVQHALNAQFLAAHRPAESKHVQPLCSQCCSQRPCQSSIRGGRKPSPLTCASFSEVQRRLRQEWGQSKAIEHANSHWTPPRELVMQGPRSARSTIPILADGMRRVRSLVDAPTSTPECLVSGSTI